MEMRQLRLVESKATGTKERILDTAEALFMEHGFEATGLRQITTGAGVNLAAVHYHFGSKEELFQAVLTRRLDPMNQERVALLDRLENDARGKPLTCEAIIGANIFRDLFSSVRDVVGGRAGGYERALSGARDAALDDMKAAARELGANGVVGIDFDYEVLGEANGMMMVAVSGTAVQMAG